MRGRLVHGAILVLVILLPVLPGIVCLASASLADAGMSDRVAPAARALSLDIAILPGCDVSDDVLATAQEEASRIWAAADVELHWMRGADLHYDAPRTGWLVARCGAAAEWLLRAGSSRAVPVAAIRFIDRAPTNVIVVSTARARGLMARGGVTARAVDRRYPARRRERLGRIVGRTLAHEIGHFLRRSDAHTATGLMRASHSLGALTGDSLAPFAIAPRDLPQRVGAGHDGG